MPNPDPWAQQIGKDIWLRHLRDIQAFDKELSRMLRAAANDAEALVARSLGDPALGATVRRTQLAHSAVGLRNIQAELWGKMTPTIMAGIERASVLAEDGLLALAGHMGEWADEDLARQFMAAAEHSIENLRSRYVNAIDLSDAVYRNQALSNNWVGKVINNGILTNKSAREIANDVAQFIRPDVPGGVSYAAKRLGRTEINNAFHETTRRAAAAQPWVEGMKWNLSGSHPRPDICNEFADQDGYNLGSGVYPPNETPGKPHPQCLCFLTTMTMNRKDFLNSLLKGDFNEWLGTDVFSAGVWEQRAVKVLSAADVDTDKFYTTGNPNDDWRFQTDLDIRAWSVWQWDYDNMHAVRRIDRNVMAGLDPFDGVEITDQQRKMWMEIGRVRLPGEAQGEPFAALTESELKDDLYEAARRLRYNVDHGTTFSRPVYRGMRVDDLSAFKVGDEFDIPSFASWTENHTEARLYGELADRVYRPGKHGVMMILQNGRGDIVHGTGRMRMAREVLTSGRYRVVDITEAGPHYNLPTTLDQSPIERIIYVTLL